VDHEIKQLESGKTSHRLIFRKKKEIRKDEANAK